MEKMNNEEIKDIRSALGRALARMDETDLCKLAAYVYSMHRAKKASGNGELPGQQRLPVTAAK